MTNEASTIRYQTIYVNPNARSWENRIVFIKEVFSEPSTCMTVINSLRLNDCYGMVVAGTIGQLRYFRKKFKELDDAHTLGKKSLANIDKYLKGLIEECGLKTEYTQEQVDKDQNHEVEAWSMKGIFDSIMNAFEGGKEKREEKLRMQQWLKSEGPRIKKLEKQIKDNANVGLAIEAISERLGITGGDLSILADLVANNPDWLKKLDIRDVHDFDYDKYKKRISKDKPRIVMKPSTVIRKFDLKKQAGMFALKLNVLAQLRREIETELDIHDLDIFIEEDRDLITIMGSMDDILNIIKTYSLEENDLKEMILGK